MSPTPRTPPPQQDIDWLFGPFLVTGRCAPLWLAHDGELWDAQLLPLVEAVASDKWRVGGLRVPYEHDSRLKAEEEGSLVWAEKRLGQLQMLLPMLRAAMESAHERGSCMAAGQAGPGPVLPAPGGEA